MGLPLNVCVAADTNVESGDGPDPETRYKTEPTLVLYSGSTGKRATDYAVPARPYVEPQYLGCQNRLYDCKCPAVA